VGGSPALVSTVVPLSVCLRSFLLLPFSAPSVLPSPAISSSVLVSLPSNSWSLI
jgi:hypothetical protein